ncbi:hypothetical protein EBB07_21370 [Paenibacillaceae bacterium]|nr:hypothetical protein EBB07_21370 [Paenibacillaceae bacterium]
MSMLSNLFAGFKWFTVFEIILFVINLTVLVRYAIPVRKCWRWVDFLPAVSLIVAIASVLYGDTSLLAIVFYTLTAVIFLCTVKRMFKPIRQTASPKRRLLRTILCLCGTIPLVLAFMFAGELRYNPVSHFSEMSYSQAFIQLNERLASEYPFGDWKQVDWDELKREYTPLFQQAEQEHNKELYYTTLREYLFSFRDGHIKIVNEDLYNGNKVFRQEVGGGFGISTLQLDNGKVMINLVLEGSPADRSGIKPGDEIVEWNGQSAQAAYRNIRWSENPMATTGDQRYNQGRFMARAPVGTDIKVAYRSADSNKLKTAMLTAYDDDYETLKKTKLKLKPTDAPVEGRLMDNGYGYVKIRYFLSSDTMPDPVLALEKLLEEFRDKGIKGLIVDVRNNPGGDDDLVSAMAGLLVSEERHYEDVSYYSHLTGRFEINSSETRTIKPAKSGYKGKTAILINHNTASSGEGLPLLLRGLPHTRVVGFTSTNGSFGVVTSPIQVEMPEGYLLRFPDGRALNADKVIQGDSNGKGEGGAEPDIKIPLNEQTFAEKYIKGQDVELQAAVEALEQIN